MGPIRVLLADNEEVFRQGLLKLLKEQPHIEVICECGTSKEAIDKSKETKPDVVLLDTQIMGRGAEETIRQIREASPDVKVAIIARPGTEVITSDLMKAGARAILAKNISSVDLIKSIDLVSSGRLIISPLFAEKFITEIMSSRDNENKKDAKVESEISARELEIVRLIAEGRTNKEIASSLFIAENTVKVHVKNMLNKLELRNRQQLVVYAVLKNWVTADVKNEDKGSPPACGQLKKQ
jgi:DNA-binding NarL/FixJ family response regulator